ncbi:EAL domain-containing protein [Rhodoferax sp.]|uniref:EAL domain-containing protein n=1 Tax=Rhodoferax sp. TaxID=50421 RepID=UPI0025DB95A5|nr:EAL domain-containing protein [Rhodoferax sp.]MCM2340079.1 EAL domain-containing protein [Rhodoferax sp.]
MLPPWMARRQRWRLIAQWGLLLAVLLPDSWAQAANPPARTVRVGVYENAPKLLLGEAGQPSGILGDVLMAMAAQEHWNVVAVPCEWQACLEALARAEIDLMPDVAYTDQRAQLFDFHQVPALLSWSQLYKLKGTPIQAITDLHGKRIAVVAGSIQASSLKNMLDSFAVTATLVQVVSFEEGFEQVQQRNVDAVAANRFFGDMQAPRFNVESTAVVFQPAQLYYATAKDKNGALLAAIDRHLKAWQAQSDSPYAAALQRWMQSAPAFEIPAYLWWVLSGLFSALLLALALNAWLRQQVVQKTARIRADEERLNTILNSVDAFIYIKDLELRYQYANSRVAQLFGRSAEQVIGQTDSAFFDAATVAKLRAHDLRVIEHGERVEEEEINRSIDGQVTQSFLSVKLPLRDSEGHIYALCGISTDMTRRVQAEEAIHQLAFYDSLTGLPNRRLLQDRVQQLLSSLSRMPQSAALMFLDVDNFKDINDTLGHDVGDELLHQIAERMRECVRAQDTLARQGGDEFVVMLVNLSTQPGEAARQAQQVAQKLLHRLSQTYQLGTHSCQTSVSIGVTLIEGPNETREELLKQADMAMYQAKAAGRNTLRFFNPEMQALVVARTTLEADLRWALAHDEFVLYYQPQVNDQGQTLGFEALLRWQHPMRGLILPAEFIAVAESSGLIVALGDWVLRNACLQLQAFSQQASQRHWTVAVNVGAAQFRQTDFVTRVQTTLQQTGANPARLELELTESQLVDDMPDVMAKMDALRDVGVRLSLDDFGTGYSSLAILKRLPLDQLKIDQGFVHNMLDDPQNASIIRAIVTLGDSLGLAVIAEGVERAVQRDALLALGCRHFQGYLFGQPTPGPAAAAYAMDSAQAG